MNIGALLGLTTSTPGLAPKVGATGFEALLAGLLGEAGSPPIDGVSLVPSGGPPGEWPPPPPPPLQGLGVEELKTSEPNAPSKKPDLPAPSEAQPNQVLGLIAMAMPWPPTGNAQVEAFLKVPIAGRSVPVVGESAETPTVTAAPPSPLRPLDSFDPLQAAFDRLLGEPELNVKMVRIDVPVVEQPILPTEPSTAQPASLVPDPQAVAPILAAERSAAQPAPPVHSTQPTDVAPMPVPQSQPAPESMPIATQGRLREPLSRTEPSDLPQAPVVVPAPSIAPVQLPTAAPAPRSTAEVRPNDDGAQPAAAEPNVAVAKPVLAATESPAPKAQVNRTSEPTEVEGPGLEQPSTKPIEVQGQDEAKSDSNPDKDQFDEKPTGDEEPKSAVTPRPQQELAHSRPVAKANPLPEPTEMVREPVASRALQAHADRIEAFAATRPRGAVTIDMDPLDLGKIQLVVKQSEGMVEAHIVAQDERVRQVLQASQAHLAQSFESRGVRLDQFQISAPSSSTTADFGRDHRQPPQPAQQAPQQGRLNAQAAARPVLVASARGGVDLTI